MNQKEVSQKGANQEESQKEASQKENDKEENGAKQLRIDFLNSKMPQPVREKVLNSFKSGKTQFLVTTDVVNRGIDIPNLNYVLNYDFPTNLVTYISLLCNGLGSFTARASYRSYRSQQHARVCSELHHAQHVPAGP